MSGAISLLNEKLASALHKQQVLPSYRRQRSAAESLFKRSILVMACIFLGLMYGFLYTLFPPQLLVYLILPLGALAVLVIWALPDTERPPTRVFVRLFFLYLIVAILWPNYLALQLPGLPWVSFRRIVIVPAVVVFLLCCSVSPDFRSRLSSCLLSSRPLLWMMVSFTLIQALVIPLSAYPAYSFNNTLNAWLTSTTLFFFAAWILANPGAANRLSRLIVCCGILLIALGLAEYQKGSVLWAGYIPSFLTVQDEAVARILSGSSRDSEYRVIGPFSVSLVMAEYLALTTPFVIDRIAKSRGLWTFVMWFVIDLLLLLVINMTQSRLGVLGWIVSHTVYGIFWMYRHWRFVRSSLIAPAFALALPAAASVFFVGMFTIPAIRNRTIGGGSTTLSDQGRKEQFEMLWPRMFRNPFGYGGGRSGEVLGYRQPGGLLTVDSYVITLILDYGVLGFCLFSAMLIFAAIKMLQIAWKNPAGEVSLALPLACALIVVMQVRLVLSQPDNIPLIFLFLGFATALIWRTRQADRNGVTDAERLTVPAERGSN